MPRPPFRRQFALALPIVFVLLTGGCAAVPDTADYNFTSVDGTDFSAFRTFAWLEQESSFTRTAVVADDRGEINELLLRETVEKTLESKGFAKAKGTQPDFYYAYRAAVFEAVNPEIVDKNEKRQREEQIRERNETATLRTEFEFDRATLYRGTLKLLIIDGDSRQIVWSGTDDGFVEAFRGSHAGGRLSVRGLLAEFPPSVR